MYHLLSGLYAEWTRKERFNILILGLTGVGKSCLLEKVKSIYLRLPALPPSKIAPTVGQNGGSASVRSLWAQYYDDAHALVWVVDAADYDQVEGKAVQSAKENWNTLKTVLEGKEMQNRPLLILANKVDSQQDETLSQDQIKEVTDRIRSWFQARMNEDAILIPEWQVVSTSALDGTGIHDSIDWLYLRVMSK